MTPECCHLHEETKLEFNLYYVVTKLQITKYLKVKKGLMYIILYWSDYTTVANASTRFI